VILPLYSDILRAAMEGFEDPIAEHARPFATADVVRISLAATVGAEAATHTSVSEVISSSISFRNRKTSG
jgi:hypothetical protein